MKNIYIVLPITLLLMGITTTTSAISATSSATPGSVVGSSSTRLEEIKERLATKVAELRQLEKKAIFGTVKNKTLTSITIETKTKDIKIELSDDLKIIQYLKGKRTVLTLDDLTQGDEVTVFGDYDGTLELLKGKLIVIQGTIPSHIHGTVTLMDKNDFSLTLTTTGGQTYVIDIETTTKVSRWDKDAKFTKSGFSKMAIGETIHAIGTPVPKKDNRISAQRIVNLGYLMTQAPTPTATPTINPELTPKATPSATPKPTQKTTVKPTPVSTSTP